MNLFLAPAVLLTALGALAASAGGAEELVFDCRRLPIGGRGPFGVIVGDWNEDGIPDLATSDARSGTLSVLLGLGKGAFDSLPPIPVGAVPRGIAAADVNDDGHLDLAVAHARPDFTYVLLGDGGGGFEIAGHYRSGESPFDAALRDLNGDGKIDLVVANESNGPVSTRLGTLAVHYGDGGGKFGEPVFLRGGRHPASLQVVDLDGRDGLDVVAVNWLSETFSVFLQLPGGTFAPVREIPTETSLPYGLFAADLDGDGPVDLVTTDLDGMVRVAYGDGEGGVGEGQRLQAGKGVRWVWGADLNKDGRLDLFTANTHDRSVSILRSVGPRRYAPVQDLFSGRIVRMARAADLDQDGWPDLIVANQGEGDLSLLLQRRTGPGLACPAPNAEASERESGEADP